MIPGWFTDFQKISCRFSSASKDTILALYFSVQPKLRFITLGHIEILRKIILKQNCNLWSGSSTFSSWTNLGRHNSNPNLRMIRWTLILVRLSSWVRRRREYLGISFSASRTELLLASLVTETGRLALAWLIQCTSVFFESIENGLNILLKFRICPRNHDKLG